MADTARLRALQNLSSALPVANAKVAAGQNSARQMQIQNAVKAAPAGSITGNAQATGQAVAEQAGAQAVPAAQQNVAQQGQVAQVGLQEQNTANQAQVQSLRQGGREQQIDAAEKLGQLDSKLKQDIYDRNMKFERDELGRATLNETQTADYVRLNAKSDDEYKNYAQQAQQANDRNLQMMEVAYKKIVEDLDFRYQKAKQAGDQQTMKDVENMRNETEARMSREKARAANSAAAWTAGGMIVGGVAGAVIGGPAGAQAGAGVGGALGGMASGLGA